MSAIAAALRMWFAVVLILVPLAFQSPVLAPLVLSGELPTPPRPAAPAGEQALRISQVFPGGGSGKTPYVWDFIELFNASDQAVALNGWTVQVTSGTSSTWGTIIPLDNLSVPAHHYFLVTATGGTTPIAPDKWLYFTLSPSGGKVRLTNTLSGSLTVVDLVGYGSANLSEGSPLPALSDSTAAIRLGGGCTDADNNAADFGIAAPTARNAASPAHACESGPAVSSTTPTSGATGVDPAANLVVTFTEPVTVSGDWFRVDCDLSGTRAAGTATVTVTDNSTTYTIDPAANFYHDDSCTLTIFSAAVSDNDVEDPPDNLAADVLAAFRTAAGQCGDPAYRIEGIQGAADSTPVVGKTRTVEGVVTGDYQGAAGLSGYFLQEEAGDGDPLTSGAIFVDEHGASIADVQAGTRVRVTGIADEVSGLTSLTHASNLFSCGAAQLPQPAQLELPLPSSATWEQYEGMLVQFAQELTVADTAALGSHGKVQLTYGDVPRAFTQAHAPGAPGYASWESELHASTIELDDGSERAYPDAIKYPPPALSAGNPIRVGDALHAGMTGIVDFRGDSFVIQPAGQLTVLTENPRNSAPVQVAGNVRAVFMSLGDYFRVVGATGGTRGASNAAEFTRQRDKVIRALMDLDADIIAVSKVANDGFGPDSSLVDLVQGLNAQTGTETYRIVDGRRDSWGADAVSVGMIYRSSAVVPVGEPAILETGAFVQDAASRLHRAPMAQAFEEKTWGERFVVAVTEWHGRSDCPADGANADTGDGQACWNAARTSAADELAAWLATDPSGSGDPDVLILGELNAFPHESPVQSLLAGQYTDLIDSYLGAGAVTTVSSGRAGVTDHALASPSLAPQIVGTSIWNANAEEPSPLDYQVENKSEAQQSSLYAPDAYRSSDQNPIAVDLDLRADPSDLGGDYGLAWHTGQGAWRLGDAWGGEDDGATQATGDWNHGQGEITVTVKGPDGQYGCLYGWFDFGDGEVQAGVAEEADGDWDSSEKVIAGQVVVAGKDQAVIFALPQGSIQSGALLNMRLRLIPAPNPGVANCSGTASAAAPNAELMPTGRADGGEVEDILVNITPLDVDLESFTARTTRTGTVLAWETTSEVDVAGFNVYRLAPDRMWRQANRVIIAARTPGASTGNRYEWVDQSAEGSVTGAYELEEVHLDRQSSFYGPITPSTEMPTTVTVSEFRGQANRIISTGAILVLLALAAAVRARIPR